MNVHFVYADGTVLRAGCNVWPTHQALPMPLHSVELPRRPCIRLRVLSAHRETHRVPLADVAPDHSLVRNILPHLALQVCLDPQPAQRVHPLRFGPWERRGWRVELRKVGACAGQILEGRGWGRRLEGEGCERPTCGDGRGGGRGEEGCDGCHLRCGEMTNAAGVVYLEAGANTAGRVATYPVEMGQSMLEETLSRCIKDEIGGRVTLTKLFSNSCTPRMWTIAV